MACLLENGMLCVIKTKSIERVIAPIAAQVCHLIIISELGGRAQEFAELEGAAEDVAKATKKMASVAFRLVQESEDDILQKEMRPAMESLIASGQNILLAAQKLSIQPQISDHKEELVIATQNVLLGTLKILLVEDDAAVRKIVAAAHWLLDSLTQVEAAPNMPSLLMSFRGFSEALLLLHNLATKRLEELRDSSQREHLGHCLEALTKCISMLYTAMQTTIKQPRNAEAQSAKKYILDHVDTTITDLISLVKSNLIESASTSQGYYVDKLQGLLQLLPSSRCSSITDSDFDSLLRDLVMHCMVVARASRKEWQLIVIKHCQHVLQLGTQISREARRLVKCYADSKQLQQDLEDNCASMKKELENLDSSMSSAIVYQMLDIFTAHDTALDELLGAATQASNIRGCGELDQLQPLLTAFLTHADLMIQVAGNISAGSTDTKAIENIETSRACLKWLRDNIVPNVLELGRSSPNASAVKRLQDLNHQWAEETRQLLGALHNVINIKQFTDLSVQEMMSDKAECQKAFEGQSADQFGEHAATLTARIKHVIDAGKRHVGKSDDPIFRNGLLVLVKQVETSASQATVAVQHCVKHFSNVKSFETFSEKVLEAIERIQILRDGLDGVNHPHILSPLREQARQPPVSQVIVTNTEANLPVLEVQNKNTSSQCHDKCLDKNLYKPAVLGISQSSDTSMTVPIRDDTTPDQKLPGLDLLPVLNEVLSATKEMDMTVLNTACTAVLELSNCYMEAAKEASTVTDHVDNKKLDSLRSEVMALTSALIRAAQEAAMNAALGTDTVDKNAALLSDSIAEMRQILLPAAGTWYHAVRAMLTDRAQKSIAANTQDISEVMLSCSDVVQSAIISTVSDFNSTLRSAPQQNITTLNSKLKKAQTNTKRLLEVAAAPVRSDRLEGPCMLWSLSIQVLLRSLDKLLGEQTHPTEGQSLTHRFTPQKALAVISENSLRIQEAAKLSSLTCKDNKTNLKIADLQEEVKVLTEAFLQSADNLSTIPLSHMKPLSRSELLQRELRIKIKMLSGLVDRVNIDYVDAVQDTVHFATLAATQTGEEKIQAAKDFEREAGQLLQNVKVASENIQHCLNYIRDPRVRCTLRFVNEHLSFLTSDIVSRARHIVETQDLRDSTGLEIRTKDWSAKAHYLVTEVQRVSEIHPEARNLIQCALRCQHPTEAPDADSDTPSAPRGRTGFEDNSSVSRKTTITINRNNEDDTGKPPVHKCEPEKDYSASLRVFRASSQALSLTETALFLKRETDRCQEDDRIVKATKEMAAQIYDMVQYLKKKGPLKTQKEFIAAAKHIAVSGQKVSKFLHIIADLSLDGRCAEELLHIVEQIRTISSQLTIIASVKAGTVGSRASDEVLVTNAQNLLQIVLQGTRAAEAAAVKGLKQPWPDSDEAAAANLCLQWRRRLQIQLAQQAANPHTDELGLRKTSRQPPAHSLALPIQMP
ncbi:uncharacterized protein LOC136718903 isoform X2 [Amia ocellicauda]